MNTNLSSKQWIAVGLIVATALIHLVLALAFGFDTFSVVFILNGLGYLALGAALYLLPQFAGQRSTIRWILIGFTAVTIIGYFAANWPDIWGPIGVVDKIIEIVLIVLLFQETRA